MHTKFNIQTFAMYNILYNLQEEDYSEALNKVDNIDVTD